jgi:predicted Rossmann fold flavoprotein
MEVSEDLAMVELFDMIVVGCGPAGMMAAIAAASAGKTVAVFEQLAAPASKLLASGGGRCNITNMLPTDVFMSRFGRNGLFMKPAMAAMDQKHFIRFLADIGIQTHSTDGLRVFPASNNAQTVADALLRRMEQLRVRVSASTKVIGLEFKDGRCVGVKTPDGQVRADLVLLSTGGQGYPKLGGSISGYELASSAGHHLVQPTPALVPLTAEAKWCADLAGVSLELAEITVRVSAKQFEVSEGGLLFTHKGISGPATLDLSGTVAQLLEKRGNVHVAVNFAPVRSREQWLAEFSRWQKEHGSKQIVKLLDAHLPRSLAEKLCELAGLAPTAKAAVFPGPARARLAGLIGALPLTILKTEGFDHAMVTRGGVSLKEIDPETLESKIMPGLLFAGEILDLDGPTGGFNLQWAFSSGWLAGSF